MDDALMLIGLAAPWVGIVANYFYYSKKVAKDQEDRFNDLNTKVEKMETKVALFWGAIETRLPDMLLKGNPIEEGSVLFNLLKMKKDGTIDKEGEKRLANLLEHEMTAKGHTAGEEVAMLLMSLALRVKEN